MTGRLFTVLSALSLLLFVAVCVMWVRSYSDIIPPGAGVMMEDTAARVHDRVAYSHRGLLSLLRVETYVVKDARDVRAVKDFTTGKAARALKNLTERGFVTVENERGGRERSLIFVGTNQEAALVNTMCQERRLRAEKIDPRRAAAVDGQDLVKE